MPSWSAAQIALSPLQRSQGHIPGTVNRVQRFLGIETSGITFSSRAQRDAVRAVSAPTPRGTNRQAPRFRAPRSAYDPITRHPFNAAPTASAAQSSSPTYDPSHSIKSKELLDLRTFETVKGFDLPPQQQPATQQRSPVKATSAMPWEPLQRLRYII